MALPATEPFTGTGALSANWTQQTSPTLVTRNTDQGAGDTAATAASACWTADAFAGDQQAQLVVKVFGDTVGPTVRSTGNNSGSSLSFYSFLINSTNDTVVLLKIVNNVPTTLITAAKILVANDVIKITVFGTTLRGYVNNVLALTITDSSLASGSAGLYLGGNVSRVDDWQGDNATVPPDDGFLVPIAVTGTPSVVGTW